MGKLDGKIALVTGGNSGIGLATAKQFVDEGAYVFITGRREQELDSALRKIGKNVTAIQGDVSSVSDLDRLFAQIKQEKGRLDIVFANAGVARYATLGSITEEGELRVRQQMSLSQRKERWLAKSNLLVAGNSDCDRRNSFMAEAQFLGPQEVHQLPSSPADHRIHYGNDPLQFGDLRLPKTSGHHPVIIVIHGGCWKSKHGALVADLQDTAALSSALTNLGIATWNIEYRQIDNPGGGWTGTFEDVANAIDYLSVLAKSYSLDLKRVVIVGHSSGGHLGTWAAARRRLHKRKVDFFSRTHCISRVSSTLREWQIWSVFWRWRVRFAVIRSSHAFSEAHPLKCQIGTDRPRRQIFCPYE